MNIAFFEAVSGPHGGLLLDSLDERSLRELNGHFATFYHTGQLPPGGEWRTWLIVAGRGFGKTRAGAEWVLSLVRREANPHRTGEGAARRAGGRARIAKPGIRGGAPSTIFDGSPPGAGEESNPIRIALVAATLDEARRVMVEGPSGLLRLARPGEIADWSPSRRTLSFANGSEAILYSGANPESLRGPEHHFAWADELAKWKHPAASWDNLQLGLRMGDFPRAMVTTTPKPSVLLRRLRDAPDSVETGGATGANPHLPTSFVAAMQAQYGGTRAGLQEIEGRLLDDIEGSLWPVELIERSRIRPPAEFARIVIGVDPPASAGGTCGIVVCALGQDGKAYVIADCSRSGASPEQWARAVADAAVRFDADRVVAEKNQGGAMVRSVLLAASATVPIELVHAAIGKMARAEPVAALFENGRAFFAGHFGELEVQLGGMIAGGSYQGEERSPDRADAMVWALWALLLKAQRPEPRISVPF